MKLNQDYSQWDRSQSILLQCHPASWNGKVQQDYKNGNKKQGQVFIKKLRQYWHNKGTQESFNQTTESSRQSNNCTEQRTPVQFAG